MEKTGKLARLIETANEVVRQNAAERINGKVASNRTQEYSAQVATETCRRLHRLGYYLEDVRGLGEKHIDAIVKDWHKNGLSNKTMQNQYSRLKIFCGWLGKPGIIDKSGIGVAAYLPEIPVKEFKVKTFTEKSKSWTGKGVDVIKKLKEVMENDQRHGHMLMLSLAFGLRKKEQLLMKLWQADKGNALKVEGSVGKGGRFRILTIDESTPYGKFQRWSLDEAKKVCGKYQSLAWAGLDYKQCENRYYHYMKKVGITKLDLDIVGHDLRAEFAENQALIRGLLPPSLGGTAAQMARPERQAILGEVSNMMGHDDLHTIGAYFSLFLRPSTKTPGIGGQVGPIIAVDAEKEIYATLWVNPKPTCAADGSYRKQSRQEASQALLTVVVTIPWAAEQKSPVSEFIKQHPHLEGKLIGILEKVGFRDLMEQRL